MSHIVRRDLGKIMISVEYTTLKVFDEYTRHVNIIDHVWSYHATNYQKALRKPTYVR